MRWAAVMVLLAGCVTFRATWRERVASLEREAPACPSFGEFDASARAASDAAAKQAPAAELLASQKAVRSARLVCARHVLETLATSREPQRELDAVAAGFAEETYDRLVKESLGTVDGSLSAMIAEAKEAARRAWRAAHEQDERDDLGAIGKWGLQHDVVIVHEERLPDGGTRWVDESGSPFAEDAEHERRFALDHDRLAAESAAHDRQAAASSAAGGPLAQHAAADEARLAAQSAAHDRQFREDTAKLGRLSGGDSAAARPLAEETEPLRGEARKPAPVESAPGERWSRVQPALAKARDERKADAVAALLEPFRDDPAHRDEAAAALEAAARQHLAFAQDTGPRIHAAALHRALAARWGSAAPAPAQGSFVLERWLCPSSKPALPSLAAGIELRLRARCQRSQPRAAPRSEKESLFESERALVKTTTDGVASVTCAGQTFQRSLHREALSLDDPALEQRRLEDDLRDLAREVRAQCEKAAREQSAGDCAALATEAPLDVEERFAAHAPSPAGPWPACFSAWFRERYGIEP